MFKALLHAMHMIINDFFFFMSSKTSTSSEHGARTLIENRMFNRVALISV